MAHTDARFSLQCTLFLAIGLAVFHHVHPNSFLSLSAVRLHVIFGRPTFLLPSGAHVRAVMQWQLSSILSTWPIHFHLLPLTSSLIRFMFVFLSMSSLDMTYGHLTLSNYSPQTFELKCVQSLVVTFINCPCLASIEQDW